MRNRYCSHACHAATRTDLHDIGVRCAAERWAPSGTLHRLYVARVRMRMDAVVPKQATFTRDEVLALYNRARREGYQGGWEAHRERVKNEQVHELYLKEKRAWRLPA
jgi:hypothetical protein